MSVDVGGPVGEEPTGAERQRRVLWRSDQAPAERTLVDILRATAARHPDALALDDGAERLTYASTVEAVERIAAQLRNEGIGSGDRVGVRIPSGTNELYLSILGVLVAGACYVPVDADDPDARADLVFGEAAVAAVMGAGGVTTRHVVDPEGGAPAIGMRAISAGGPAPEDDAWIIFTSGSTGTPKGVAVTHRSAAAFVDAEAAMFLQRRPLGPDDRVLAGLSVGFDASCEEMWLAWRYGACLVPAPRSLVRSGIDLGPWLVAQDVTVVSTVPTLAMLWPAQALDAVRLLIFGGEACPPELAARLVRPGREVWNTYGPTEATVVACGARLRASGVVRIGLPLAGWDLAVVDGAGSPVGVGEVGELVIGGVGLARYLDPQKDAEKYAPFPALGWGRAYRSGDLVTFEPEGLVFQGRADDQVKVGGRRIELGEVDAALTALPGVAAAAAAVKATGSGNQVLIGYIVPESTTEIAGGARSTVDVGESALVGSADLDVGLDLGALTGLLRARLPAPMVPRLAVVSSLPTRSSGKVDRDALPWPLPGATTGASTGSADEPAVLSAEASWVAEHWSSILGSSVAGPNDDFFAHGGGSLSAARLVSLLRERYPNVTVADIYGSPRLGALVDVVERQQRSGDGAEDAERTPVHATPRRAQLMQSALALPLQGIVSVRWITALAIVNRLLVAVAGPLPWVVTLDWWILLLLSMVFFVAPGRMAVAAVAARVLLRRLQPGVYPRGGSVHLRIWFAERLSEAMGADHLSGAPWIPLYARALGATIGKGVVLHSLPPVTGMLTLEPGCSIEPEVDLTGYWIDGDQVVVGAVHVGRDARVGARSTLLPGSEVGANADVEPGSAVMGKVPAGQSWAGSPAARVKRPPRPWPAEAPGLARGWVPIFAVSSMVIGGLPMAAAFVGLAVVGWFVRDAGDLSTVVVRAMVVAPLGTLTAFGFLAGVTVMLVRLFSLGLRPGHHPVRSRIGWQTWCTIRLMDDARTWLFPIYSSLATPAWLRLLGADIGKGVEASTVFMVPSMATVADGAFLADDTMVGSYELGSGWLRIEPVKIGRRAFIGNSGMTAPGRRVRKNSLVAVLSHTPERSKAGTSWLGSPPVRLRRPADDTDESLTYHPSTRKLVARSVVEAGRFVPVVASAMLGLAVLFVFQALAAHLGWHVALLLGGPVLVGAGAVAALVSSIAKWVLVGRIDDGDHPLWESFVWRTEVADTFMEILAAPWFARAATGTPALVWWLRSLGAKVGKGVWCETYWLPEADLVLLGDGVSVNRGCVLQTHLFHDRVMSLDRVMLHDGATIGPHSVILPAAGIGAGATVGPASLVMRGDELPAGSRWMGNPTVPWRTPVQRPSS